MSSKLLLTTKLDQRLMMNQKLKEMITILQYTTIELKQKITEFLESNPLLELLEDSESETSTEVETESMLSADFQYNGVRKQHTESLSDDYIQNIPVYKSLRDTLIEQTLNCHFNAVEQEAATILIDAIDEDGLITISDEEIMSQIAKNPLTGGKVSMTDVTRILQIIQTFDPPGIAARSINESLLLQIEARDDGSSCWQYARELCRHHALLTSGMNLKKLEQESHLSHDQLMQGLAVINELDFHPAKQISSQADEAAEPELFVKKIGNKWRVFLTNSILTRLDVNNQYKSIIKQHARDKQYKTILQQLQEANLLVNGVKRRNTTLLSVATYIVEKQQAYFEQGDAALLPINLSEVAQAIDCHESTISRITTGKYMATPHGIVELKFFFPSQLNTELGDATSSTSIKQSIRELIDSEKNGQTYSDDDIANCLKSKGIKISRRTIAKYRESMGIPSSYQRQQVNQFKR